MATIFNDPNHYTSSGSTFVSNDSVTVTIDPAYSYNIDTTQSGTWSTVSTTNTISWASQSLIKLKLCRSCNHGHVAGGPGCIEQVGQMMTFVDSCACKEYVPTENLEFLEWCYEKKQKGL